MHYEKVEAIVMTYEEFDDYLNTYFFHDSESFTVDVYDVCDVRITYYPDENDEEGVAFNVYEALPVLSEALGKKFVDLHAERRGIWLECAPSLVGVKKEKNRVTKMKENK